MNKYIYKIYGACYDTGYELITKTADVQKARAILQDNTYSKIMIVRYDVLQNMDEVVALVHNDNFSRRLKKGND